MALLRSAGRAAFSAKQSVAEQDDLGLGGRECSTKAVSNGCAGMGYFKEMRNVQSWLSAN